MSTEWERGLDPSKEWADLMDRIDEAAAKPSRERFTAVGRAAVTWAQRPDVPPRESTSNSASESLVHKEEPLETSALDHLGRVVVADAEGSFTTTATEDHTRLVAGERTD
jgi:hypothetical protein